MISKELLGKVLGLTIMYVQDYFELNEVIYETKTQQGSLNKYELAFSIRYYLSSTYDFDLNMNKNIDAIFRDAETFYKNIKEVK